MNIQFSVLLLFFICLSTSFSDQILCVKRPYPDILCDSKEINCRTLKKYTGKFSFNKTNLIRNYLDFIGYLNQQWDTLSPDSIRIIPGKRAIVQSETVTGADSVILEQMKQPFSYDAGKIESRAADISKIMANRGYPFVQVLVQISSDSLNESCNIIYKANTDDRYKFSDPYFTGTFKTAQKTLLHDISFKKGEFFSLEKINESIRRLQTRSYISQVKAADLVIFPSDSIESTVRVPLLIEDKSGLGLEGALGFETDNNDKLQFYGNLIFSLLNLFHSGESASFEYAGDKTFQQLKLELSKPWIFNLPFLTAAGMDLEVVDKQYGYLQGWFRILAEIGSLWNTGIKVEAHETSLSGEIDPDGASKYIGMNYILARIPELYQKGVFSKQLLIETGTGIAKKGKTSRTRTNFAFSLGIHAPVFSNQAIAGRIVTRHLMTREKDLVPAEMFRIGGHNSVRGYSDKQFSFRTVMYGQLEYMLYFKKAGSVYIFTDGGIGFRETIGSDNNYQTMIGYGAGLRFPSKLGTMTLEWAGNYKESKIPDRIHVRFQNPLSDILTNFSRD